jgi:hypothetical protein
LFVVFGTSCLFGLAASGAIFGCTLMRAVSWRELVDWMAKGRSHLALI